MFELIQVRVPFLLSVLYPQEWSGLKNVKNFKYLRINIKVIKAYRVRRKTMREKIKLCLSDKSQVDDQSFKHQF